MDTQIGVSGDGAGGAEVAERADVTRVVAADPQLRALDVLDCPHVREIDLRGARPGIHLRVAGCPSLERVRVPAAGEGAVLHLDFGGMRPRLAIEGWIDVVDACWWWSGEAESFETKPARKAGGPRAGAFIGVRGAEPPPPVELVVVVGSDAQAPDTLDVPSGAVTRELRVVDDAALVALRVASDVRLAHVAARRCPRLATVALPRGLSRATLEDAPALCRVDGHGHHLGVLRSARVDVLHVAGVWASVYLGYSGPRRLDCAFADDLEFFMCEGVERVVTGAASHERVPTVRVAGPHVPEVEGGGRVSVVPLSAAAAAQAFAYQDAATQQALVQWAATRRRPESMVLALQVLLSAARAGFDPETLWEIRRTRRAISSPRKRGEDAETWAWKFPADLCDRGWSADLELWLACRGAPGAAAWEQVLARSSEPHHLAALGRSLVRHEAAPARVDELMAWLGAALRHGAAHGARIGAGGRKGKKIFAEGVPVAAQGDLRVLVAALAKVRHHRECPARIEDVCRWLLRRLPDRHGVEMLGALRQHGSAAASAALGDLVSGLRDDDDLRRFALLQAILPVRESTFAFPATVAAPEMA